MAEAHGKVGFASPASANKVIKRRRAGVELIATVGLAIALVVAITAVSIGAAHAQVLRPVGENSDATLVVVALVGLAMAGLAGMGRPTAAAARAWVSGRDRH